MPPNTSNTTDATAADAATTTDAAPATATAATPATARRAVPAAATRAEGAPVSAAEHAATVARVAQLEAELATVSADRDAASEQLRAASARLGPGPTPEERLASFERLTLRFVVATEVQAMLALAATRSGREASDLRAQADEYLRATIGHR